MRVIGRRISREKLRHCFIQKFVRFVDARIAFGNPDLERLNLLFFESPQREDALGICLTP